MAASAGALFGKAHTLSDEVHMAMVSRAYRGDAKTLSGFHLALRDAVFAFTCLAAGFLILWGDHLVGH